MATVILGVAAAGILLPFTTGAKVQAEGIRRTLSAKLASDLMEQIIITPSAQVDGYTYIELQGQIKDATGSMFTDPRYANFSREAICEYVHMPQQDDATVPNFIRITVRVYYNDREIVTLSRLVAE